MQKKDKFIDALFETVSGFTTTGASILSDVEALPKSLLFWRSFTHWIGGMGVLVFVLAIMPKFSDRSIHLIRAEMAGPIVGKLVPKAKDTDRYPRQMGIPSTMPCLNCVIFIISRSFRKIVPIITSNPKGCK